MMNIDQAIDLYREHDMEMGFEERRYPACIDCLGEVVAIADESENGSSLRMYDAYDFIGWMEKAKTEFDAGLWDDLTEAIFENEPQAPVEESH